VTLGNPGPAQGGNPAGLQGQLGVDEPAGQGFPGGWGGGIHSWDIYANGTVGAGENGSLNAYMNDFDGGIGGGGQVITTSPNGGNYAYMQSNNNGSSVVTNGTVQGGYVNSTGNVNAQNALTAGGGGYITDSGYGAVANTFTANVLGANYVYSNGNASVNGQLQVNYDEVLGTANGSAYLGGGCGPNGSIAANANGSGQILACESGIWVPMGNGGGPVQVQQFEAGTGPIPGLWQLCAAETEVNEIGGIGISGGPYNIGGSYFYTWYQSSSRPNGGGVGQYICENWAYPY